MKSSALFFSLGLFTLLIYGSDLPKLTAAKHEANNKRVSAPSTIVTSFVPLTTAPPVLDKEVTLCIGEVHAPGFCHTFRPTPGQCVELAQTGLDNGVTEVTVSNLYCRFHFDPGCVEDNGFRHFDLDSEPTGIIQDLSQYGDGSANDQVSSFKCIDRP